jgi:hypothetical protein
VAAGRSGIGGSLAVPGYDTHQEVAAFAAHGMALAPDIVVVFLVGNDAALPIFLRRRAGSILDRSALATLLRARLGGAGSDDGLPSDLRRGRRGRSDAPARYAARARAHDR